MLSEPFEYMPTPDGGRMRYKFWPGAISTVSRTPKTVILMQGRASFMEKFSTVIHQLQSSGYHVWSFDWRGQGLSSRLINDTRKGYIDSYETYIGDFKLLLQNVILPKVRGPLMILGQSMGCHIALRFLERHPGIFDSAFLTAPMLELNTGGYAPSVAKIFVKTACKLGFSTSFVPGHSGYDPAKEPFEGNLLTHDRKSFIEHRDLQRKNPLLSVGGVTFSWAHATFESMAYLNTPERLGKIDIPVYVLLAGEESVVSNVNAPTLLSWLPRCTYKVYAGARHQLLSESPVYMKQFWEDFERFSAAQDLVGVSFKEKHFDAAPLPTGRVFPTLPNDFKGNEAHP